MSSFSTSPKEDPASSCSGSTTGGMKGKSNRQELTCLGCGSSTSASCTGCCASWCHDCIKLLEQKCPHCCKEIFTSEASKAARSNCAVHAKEQCYYCLTCQMDTCIDCIIHPAEHKRHIFDRIDAVYEEKITVTNGKLTQLKRHIEKVENVSEQARHNLHRVEVTEKTLISDMNTLLEAGKTQISPVVGEKRRILQDRIDLPAKRSALIRQLEDKVTALSQSDFIKQHNHLNEECDQLTEQFKEYATDSIECYDIGCDIIPEIKMKQVDISSLRAADGFSMTAMIDDSCGDFWKLCISKGDPIIVEVSPFETDQLSTSRQYTVTMEISISDTFKVLRKHYVIQRMMAKMEFTKAHGFIADEYLSNAALVFRIAIQPLNVVEACALYKEKVEILAKSVDFHKNSADNFKISADYHKNEADIYKKSAEEKQNSIDFYKNSLQLSESCHTNAQTTLNCTQNLLKQSEAACESLTRELNGIKNYAVGFYSIDLWDFTNLNRSYLSTQLSDFNGNKWQIEISLYGTSFSAYFKPSKLFTFGQNSLFCTFFIELLHGTPKKNVKKTGQGLFNTTGPGLGWPIFEQRGRIINDDGFERNGRVWFRFGLRPQGYDYDDDDEDDEDDDDYDDDYYYY